MSIGLMDGDMSKYTYVPFNLDIMKLSTYYKKKREIVSLSPSFLPDKYTNFIYRKDYVDGSFPPKLLDYNNVIYGGAAFSNGTYHPMTEDIERCIPDKQIYQKFENEFCTNKIYTTLFNHMLNAAHLRLSLDGRTIWADFERAAAIQPRTNIIFLHDKDLTHIEGSEEVIRFLLNTNKKKERYLATKFPLIMDKDEVLCKWFYWAPARMFFPVHYHGLIEDETLYQITSTVKGKSVCNQLQYFVTSGCSSEQDFVENRLPHLYQQVSYLHTQRTKILLKYDEDFFSDKRWNRVLDLMNFYLHSLNQVKKIYYEDVVDDDSIVNFIKHLKDESSVYNKSFFKLEEIRDLFMMVREKSPELFDKFYNTHRVIYKGGKFVYE